MNSKLEKLLDQLDNIKEKFDDKLEEVKNFIYDMEEADEADDYEEDEEWEEDSEEEQLIKEGTKYVLMERLKDLIAKNYEEKKKEQSNKLLLKNRKEVEINANGSGYTVKEGTNKGKTLAHIQLKSKEI